MQTSESRFLYSLGSYISAVVEGRNRCLRASLGFVCLAVRLGGGGICTGS